MGIVGGMKRIIGVTLGDFDVEDSVLQGLKRKGLVHYCRVCRGYHAVTPLYAIRHKFLSVGYYWNAEKVTWVLLSDATLIPLDRVFGYEPRPVGGIPELVAF